MSRSLMVRRIPDDVILPARARAAREGRSLMHVVIELLRAWVTLPPAPQSEKQLRVFLSIDDAPPRSRAEHLRLLEQSFARFHHPSDAPVSTADHLHIRKAVRVGLGLCSPQTDRPSRARTAALEGARTLQPGVSAAAVDAALTRWQAAIAVHDEA